MPHTQDHPRENVLGCSAVSAGYGGDLIVKNVSLDVPAGKVTALIGPNGSGKSTLLKVLGRQLRPAKGRVELAGRDITKYGAREFARQLAFLPQQPVVPEGMSVRELIAFGRYPYAGAFASLTANDHAMIRSAAQQTGIEGYLDASALALSGGQKQRMWIAMTLVQDTDILLLDEPTTFLDPAHQLAVLDLVQELNARGKTIVMVVHDMAHAAKYSDYVAVLKDGRIVEYGDTQETLTPELVAKAFGISAIMVTDPATGRSLPFAYGINR